jgi:NADH-quinone oxidoreductase subunit C
MPEELADFPELAQAVEALRARFGDAIAGTAFAKRELSVTTRPDTLLAVLEFLKTGLGFNALNDLIGLDRFPPPGDPRKRFSILYQLYRFSDHVRIRVVIEFDEREAVPSVTSLFRSADWAEREVFDMFGVRFSGHSDLRRIYLPDEFVGHPLRKDFPLEG